VAVLGAHHEAHVHEDHDQEHVEEVLPHDLHAAQGAPDQVRPDQPDHPSHEGADELVAGNGARLELEPDDAQGADGSRRRAEQRTTREGVVNVSGVDENEDYEKAEENKPYDIGHPPDLAAPETQLKYVRWSAAASGPIINCAAPDLYSRRRASASWSVSTPI